MSGSDVAQRTLYDAEAGAELQRAAEQLRAVGKSLDAAAGPLAMAKRGDLQRQLERAREFHRLVSVRVDVLARRVAEGA